MADESPYVTRTMARLYSRQGNLSQAARIYRLLLEREPDPDPKGLADELAAVESRMHQGCDDRIQRLFTQWFQLAFAYRRILALRKLQPPD